MNENTISELRQRFQATELEIPDGWEVLAEGHGGGAYGYGSEDLLMYLRSPEGRLYAYEYSCCSCGDGVYNFGDIVETNIETIERDLEGYTPKEGSYFVDSTKAEVCREALAKIRGLAVAA